MRPPALAALAAILCLSAPGAHPDDTWKGIKMYKKVTKTDPSHPIPHCFGPHGDIYAVELTDAWGREGAPRDRVESSTVGGAAAARVQRRQRHPPPARSPQGTKVCRKVAMLTPSPGPIPAGDQSV
ncbi:MAG: hypothetical protein KA419_12995 [Acidobacteria bacterium]|nr:hypothetical protein [Acidobacteriota bacterium]